MMIGKLRFCLLFLSVLIMCPSLHAQKSNDPVKINRNGRMFWKSDNTEAYFWGVNYSAPFAHGYRQMGRLGEDLQKNIDIDTYHLARLGINAYRIHVWASEISDSLGNLLENDHLKMLDYLIFRLQQRGIYIFLTPIRYGGPGYPEPDIKTPGFADDYPKSEMYLIPEAISAQERYLRQFVNHVNPYTGKPYKNDPMVVGFEICNEPAHSKPDETTSFVKRMIGAVKSTGCTKPVFYNVTQNISLLDEFIRGGTSGCTFQWYPSGLVANHEVIGNFLPHVDDYLMPFKNDKYFLNQARLVYEFDAADVGRSYLYPPMALSFKEAGMQWVTMFAYDPVALAPCNTEYQTHFLNLVYAPQKAIGFKIAGVVFRNPQYKRDREHESSPFDVNGLRVSYKNDYSELLTDELFYYTKSTTTNPADRSKLKSIAGYGSSPIVSYKGYGDYFLDKITDGIWRLEVFPDALWVRDPFSKAVPQIRNVVIKWKNYEMGIDLPDLGKNFIVTGINKGNDYHETSREGRFNIKPGAYILSLEKISDDIKKTEIGVIKADEYSAPPETNNNFYFLQSAPEQVSENQPVKVSVKVISPVAPIKKMVVQPYITGFRGAIILNSAPIPMERIDEYLYEAIIPDSLIRPGILTYNIISESDDGKLIVYPGGVEGPTTRWDYFNPVPYTIRVLPSLSEVRLWGAEETEQVVTFAGNPSFTGKVIPSGIPGISSLKFRVTGGNEVSLRPNTSGMQFVIQNYIGDIIKGISPDAENFTDLVVYGKTTGEPVNFEVSLINRDGNAYTSKSVLFPGKAGMTISLKDFTEGKLFLLPRPYPVFLPYWYVSKIKRPFMLSEIERIQLLIPEEGNESPGDFEISSVTVK